MADLLSIFGDADFIIVESAAAGKGDFLFLPVLFTEKEGNASFSIQPSCAIIR